MDILSEIVNWEIMLRNIRGEVIGISRKILILGLAFIFLFSYFRCTTAADGVTADGVTIEVEGMAPLLNNDLAQAREMAITDALRKAVEQIAGTFIDVRTESKNYQIITDTIKANSEGYVSNYNVLDGWKEQDYYKVRVRATIKRDAVKQTVDSLKLTLLRAGKPRLMILVEEPVVETQLTQGFISSGFPVVDQSKVQQLLNTKLGRLALNGDGEAMEQLASQYQAEILIIGSSKSERIGETDGIIACNAYLNVRAVRPDTGETLASQTFNERGVDLSENNAYQKALAKVSDRMVEYLKGQLGKQLVDNARTVQIAIRGITYAELQLIQKHIKNTPGVSNVFLRNFNNGSALLDLETSILSNQLADIISGWTDLSLEIVNLSGAKVEVQKKI